MKREEPASTDRAPQPASPSLGLFADKYTRGSNRRVKSARAGAGGHPRDHGFEACDEAAF